MLPLRRPLGRTQTLGLLVGFAGVVAISWADVQCSRATTLGAGLVVLAVVLYGLAVNLAVPLQQRYGAPCRCCCARSWPPWCCCSLRPVEPARLRPRVGGGAGAGDPGHRAGVRPDDHAGGAVGGPRRGGTYFIPVVAIALGVIFLNERVAPVALLGTALVLGGAWLTSRREASRRTATGAAAGTARRRHQAVLQHPPTPG